MHSKARSYVYKFTTKFPCINDISRYVAYGNLVHVLSTYLAPSVISIDFYVILLYCTLYYVIQLETKLPFGNCLAGEPSE